MSIRVKNITKKYNDQLALNNVSFEIPEGQIVGFLGPNGAGKSTMMKIITGFIPPTSGTVEVCDQEIKDNSLEVRKLVGYLPEHNPLYLDMYVKEYLQFVAGLYKLKNGNARVKEMINITGLELEQHKKIGALSKGYRQRVGLAQAIISNPKVLILDEPTTGLDPNQIIGVRDLIKDLGQEKTILLSTHIMQEVKAICEHVIIINKGQIVFNDHVNNISSSTLSKQQIVEVEFNKQINVAQLQKYDGIGKVQQISTKQYKISSLIKDDIRPTLFHFAVDNNYIILSMTQNDRSLEEVFRELTY